MANLVNYAIAYAKKGQYVLPMHGKQPLIKFANKPALTIDEIKSIWTANPDAAIALRTVDFFVIDIDEHDGGEDGFKSIHEFDHRELLTPTLSQKTAGGGRQLFYLKRKDTMVRQNIGWLPGVDVKAHKNNYVVVAPSERNGRNYKWENHNPIVTPSQQLIAMINQRRNSYDDDDYDFQKYHNSGRKTATTELLEMVVNGFGDNGTRNNNLTSFVGALLFRNVGVDEAIRLAYTANSNTPEPINDRELRRTIESVVDKELRRREEIE